MNVSEGLDVTFVSIGGNMVMVMMMMGMLERRWDDASVSIRRVWVLDKGHPDLSIFSEYTILCVGGEPIHYLVF